MRPEALLVISRALQALATPIIAFLVSGAAVLGASKTPVSFCNVLFVGNCCAALLVISKFGRREVLEPIEKLEFKHKALILLFGGLSAWLSALIFTALMTTTVANAVLLARLGPVLYAILAAWMLSQPVKKSEWAGFAFIVVGVMATVLSDNGFQLAKGDWLIMLSAVAYASTTLVSKKLLKLMPMPTVVFCRNLVSAFIFFWIALLQFGPHHFMEVFSGQLWIVMLIYSLIVIVASQFTFYKAVAVLDAATVAKWTLLSPVLAILYAYILNGQSPSRAQLVALALVSIGVLIASAEKRVPKEVCNSPEGSLAAS